MGFLSQVCKLAVSRLYPACFSVYSPGVMNVFTFSSVFLKSTGASLVAQMLKYLPTMWETQIRFLGGEGPLEKEMAVYVWVCF